MAAKSKEVTQAGNTDMTDSDTRPSYLAPSGNSSMGNEECGKSDIAIPRISIIQDLSPQRKKNDPEYIPGAEEGMMFNTVTGALYTDSLLLIPVYYRKEYLIWVDRKLGGGFRGSFATNAEAAQAASGMEEKVEVVDTAQNFCLISDDNGITWSEAVLSMSRAGMSVAKKLNSMILSREADRFAQTYRVSAATKSNTKGDFFVFKFDWAGWATEGQYINAKKVYESIKEGAAKIDYSDSVGSARDQDENSHGGDDPF
jgi:hypothetical protein